MPRLMFVQPGIIYERGPMAGGDGPVLIVSYLSLNKPFSFRLQDT